MMQPKPAEHLGLNDTPFVTVSDKGKITSALDAPTVLGVCRWLCAAQKLDGSRVIVHGE